MKGGKEMIANKIATFVGSVPASTAGICGHMQGKGRVEMGSGVACMGSEEAVKIVEATG